MFYWAAIPVFLPNAVFGRTARVRRRKSILFSSMTGRVIPVEVKFGHNSRLRSLRRFMEKAPHDVAVRLGSKPVPVDAADTPGGKRFRLLSLPCYYAGMLEPALKKWG